MRSEPIVFFVLDYLTEVDLITFAKAWRGTEPRKAHLEKSDHLDSFVVFEANSCPTKITKIPTTL